MERLIAGPTVNGHTATVFEEYPTQYEMPDEVMRWQPPECFICKERKYCYVSMPWGSNYDGDIICGDCCRKYFDPVIAVVTKKE